MRRSVRPLHVVLTAMCLALAAMWVYALFLAPKTPVDLIRDRAWSARAETVCAPVKARNSALPGAETFRSVTPLTKALQERAAVADEITTNLRAMLTELRATQPTDEPGRKGVALWLADYDRYLVDRDEHVAAWRRGVDQPFAETVNELGAPASARMDVYTRLNRMPSCATPADIG